MMTLEECYRKLHGNYSEAKGRLMNERLMDKVLRHFPDDPTMNTLHEMIATGDKPASFRAIHTLKGLTANLAFTELYQAAYDLTEQMRSLEQTADPDLLAKVEESYQLVIDTIAEYSK